MTLLSEALDHLLGPNRIREDTDEMTLTDALAEALRRRERNTRDGGAVIAELLGMGWTYRRIEHHFGLAPGTAHRWRESVRRPSGAEEPTESED